MTFRSQSILLLFVLLIITYLWVGKPDIPPTAKLEEASDVKKLASQPKANRLPAMAQAEALQLENSLSKASLSVEKTNAIPAESEAAYQELLEFSVKTRERIRQKGAATELEKLSLKLPDTEEANIFFGYLFLRKEAIHPIQPTFGSMTEKLLIKLNTDFQIKLNQSSDMAASAAKAKSLDFFKMLEQNSQDIVLVDSGFNVASFITIVAPDKSPERTSALEALARADDDFLKDHIPENTKNVSSYEQLSQSENNQFSHAYFEREDF